MIAVTTQGDILKLLTGSIPPPEARFNITVVGNGPLHDSDYADINASRYVLRFNDMNFYREGDRITVRIRRDSSKPAPSWVPKVPEWGVSHDKTRLPGSISAYTPLYSRYFGSRNTLPPTVMLFPQCEASGSNWQNSTNVGPSTGAVILDQLQQHPQIERVDVFGMNWNSLAVKHIDFVNRTLVHGCCTKCSFHGTNGSAYGDGWVSGLFGFGGVLGLGVGSAAVWWGASGVAGALGLSSAVIVVWNRKRQKIPTTGAATDAQSSMPSVPLIQLDPQDLLQTTA